MLGGFGRGLNYVGLYDVDGGRASAVAAELSTVSADRDALFREADAAIIAVPTVDHHEVASAALDAGLDVLIEKPIAATLEDAEALVALPRPPPPSPRRRPPPPPSTLPRALRRG